MALLTLDDIQETLNIDLSDPNGQAVASNLITAVVAWVETYLGFPLEETQHTSYFDEGHSLLWLPTSAPVSGLTISTYNTVTGAYDPVSSSYVRSDDSGTVNVAIDLPSGFQAVKVTYIAGWTASTLPKDLRQALIDIIGIKLLEAATFSGSAGGTESSGADEESTTPTGPVKRIQADTYTVEFSTAQTDAYWKSTSSHAIGDSTPAGPMETISRYKRPFAVSV